MMRATFRPLHRWLSAVVNALWYRENYYRILAYGLLPFSWIFQLILQCRYVYYRLHPAVSYRAPVIVVGNLTVGGTGKTPLVAALAQFLREQGHRPGIVMRGYQAHFKGTTMAVLPASSPWEAGEESVLLAQKTGCPVMIGKRRSQVVEALLAAHPEVDVVLSDDGLQHYAMARDMEIAVVDGQRGLGNGFCLPAGPLREPKARLQSVDYVVSVDKQLSNMIYPIHSSQSMHVDYSIQPSIQQVPLSDFIGKKVHAVAGIGDPLLFFTQLRAKGIDIIPHVFADHHWYAEKDLDFKDGYPILMTEKDAIKCRHLRSGPLWYIPLSLTLPEPLKEIVLRKLATWTKSSLKSWPARFASNR